MSCPHGVYCRELHGGERGAAFPHARKPRTRLAPGRHPPFPFLKDFQRANSIFIDSYMGPWCSTSLCPVGFLSSCLLLFGGQPGQGRGFVHLGPGRFAGAGA
jgi:hypothetical protein